MSATTSQFAATQALIVKAGAVKVISAPTREDAATLWSLIRTARKEAEIEQDQVCGPLKAAYEEARKPYLDLRKECEAWEARLQSAMGAYDREQERIAREEQAKIQAKIDKQNAKAVEKAEAKGVEPVLKVAPVVQAPPKSLDTQAGTKQTRTVKNVYIPKNSATLMRDFPQLFVLDMAKFNAAARAGLLDGRPDVEVKEEYIYSQR